MDRLNNVITTHQLNDENRSDQESMDLNKLKSLPKARFKVRDLSSSNRSGSQMEGSEDKGFSGKESYRTIENKTDEDYVVIAPQMQLSQHINRSKSVDMNASNTHLYGSHH